MNASRWHSNHYVSEKLKGFYGIDENAKYFYFSDSIPISYDAIGRENFLFLERSPEYARKLIESILFNPGTLNLVIEDGGTLAEQYAPRLSNECNVYVINAEAYPENGIESSLYNPLEGLASTTEGWQREALARTFLDSIKNYKQYKWFEETEHLGRTQSRMYELEYEKQDGYWDRCYETMLGYMLQYLIEYLYAESPEAEISVQQLYHIYKEKVKDNDFFNIPKTDPEQTGAWISMPTALYRLKKQFKLDALDEVQVKSIKDLAAINLGEYLNILSKILCTKPGQKNSPDNVASCDKALQYVIFVKGDMALRRFFFNQLKTMNILSKYNPTLIYQETMLPDSPDQLTKYLDGYSGFNVSHMFSIPYISEHQDVTLLDKEFRNVYVSIQNRTRLTEPEQQFISAISGQWGQILKRPVVRPEEAKEVFLMGQNVELTLEEDLMPDTICLISTHGMMCFDSEIRHRNYVFGEKKNNYNFHAIHLDALSVTYDVAEPEDKEYLDVTAKLAERHEYKVSRIEDINQRYKREKRTRYFQVRVNEYELKVIEKKAQELGLTKSEYVRKVSLGEIKAP